MKREDQRSKLSLTNGFLPTGAFVHLEPTRMGLVDLDRPLAISWPVERPGLKPARDSLLLIRLCGEPLAVVHVEGTVEAHDNRELATLVWAKASRQIQVHAERHRCCAPPDDASSLRGGLAPKRECGAVAHAGARVSVVIPTRGRPEQLRRCLGSLAALDGDFEVLVVDNAPEDQATRELLSSWSSLDGRFRYVAEPRPGSMVARNRGIAEAQGEIVAFTDDDVLVDAGWLDWLAGPFADPEVGAVTGMVLPMELETPAQKRFEQYAGFSKGVLRHVYDLRDHRADDRLLYPFFGGIFGSGNSMAFRRERMLAAGGFDPALGNGTPSLAGGDTEALSAAVLRGERLVYEPRSLCWHQHRRDDGSLRRQIFSYGVGFTAILTKALITDRRFVASALRSVPVAIEHRRRRARSAVVDGAALPPELSRLEHVGMAQGPWRYLRSRAWARRLELDRAIAGG